MNTLLLNRDGFVMPDDGWYQVAPLGEFAHAGAGVVQVVDVEACAAMVNRFAEDAAAANFAGLLVDFDHFSLDGEKRSEAAGWITGLEMRNAERGTRNGEGSRGGAEAQSGDGLWAQIRWSDLGEEAVKGGRYRFLSPVWSRSDCQDLGPSAGSGQGARRVRPVRLLNAAVTNDPNLKGMRPLSNSGRAAGNAECGTRNANANAQQSTSNAQRPTGVVANAGGPARFKWVLSGDGKHCPSCAAVAGQVHTMAEWDAAGIRPGGGALYCLGKCKCRLVATNEASGGVVTGVVKRHRPVVNRSNVGAVGRSDGRENANVQHRTEAETAVREVKRAARARMLANQGWTDEARAASLAVRRAKAEARQSAADAKTDKVSDSVKGRYKQLLAELDAAGGDPEKLMEASARYLASRSRDGTDFTLADIEAVRECLKRDKTLTDYQLRLAEDALTEASAWLRGDARGLLDVAEKEIAGDLQAAGLRLTAVEALRRYLNPLRYYAEYKIDVVAGGLPDWVDEFKAYEDLQHQYKFLRPGAKSRTQAFGPTSQDKLMLKRNLITPEEVTEALKTRAETAARAKGYLPSQTTTKAGGLTRGPVKVLADGVKYDNLPPGPKPGWNSMSGKTAKLSVETAAYDVKVMPTRPPGVSWVSAAAALVPMAIQYLTHVVPVSRQANARHHLERAAKAARLPKEQSRWIFTSAGSRIFLKGLVEMAFGNNTEAQRAIFARFPIGMLTTDGELAKRYGREMVAKSPDKVANSWSDEARAASLAVRRAKAEAREKLLSGTQEKRGRAYTRPELGRLFLDVGYDAMTPGQIDNYAEFIRQRMREGTGPNAVEREFLQGYSEQNAPGIGRRDPVFQWCETQRRADQAMKEVVGMNTFAAAKRAAEIDERIRTGLGYTPEEGDFYVKWKTACQFFAVRERQRERANKDKKHWEPLPTGLMDVLLGYEVETGRRIKEGRYVNEKAFQNRWSDTARAASMAVRKAKAAARKQLKDGKATGKDGAVRAINPDAGKGPGLDTGIYLGGSKYFDESTGRYVWPKKKQREMPDGAVDEERLRKLLERLARLK